jgi:hypothetical protein
MTTRKSQELKAEIIGSGSVIYPPLKAEGAAIKILPFKQLPAADGNIQNCFHIYSDSRGSGYLFPNIREDGWVKGTESRTRRYLKDRGISTTKPDDKPLSPIEKILNQIARGRVVTWAGAVAGRFAGPLEDNGKLILVTESPRIIQPTRGNCETIQNILLDLFGQEQLSIFLCWLKLSYETYRSGIHRPAQACAFVGEPDSGKSFLQNHIITPVLGGRSAKPINYMKGYGHFSGKLFGHEHLLIEDDISETDDRTRRNLASFVKQFVANEQHECNTKFEQEIMLKPTWRVTISCNDRAENLAILPPLTRDVRDKLIIFKVRKASMPMPTNTEAQRHTFALRIAAELPAFCHYLLALSIPEELKADRFGITFFHHPEVVKALHEISKDYHVLELIDTIIFKDPTTQPWEGNATELEKELRSEPRTSTQLNQIYLGARGLGRIMTSLCETEPKRVQSRLLKGRTMYEIKPPNE